MSKITALRLLAIAPSSVKSFVRKPRKIAEPVRRAINMLSSKHVDLPAVLGKTKKIISPRVARATAKAINFLQEQDISIPKLVRGALYHGKRLPTYSARAINSGARRAVNRLERSGYIDPGDAARWRYAIETEGAKSRQKWNSPQGRDYEIDLYHKPDEIIPTDFRSENQGKTIDLLVRQMQEFDEDVPQKVKREINREIQVRTAGSTQHRQRRREESKTKEQERAQARVQQALKELQPIRTIDAQGNEVVDASRLKSILEEFTPSYEKYKKLGIGGLGGGTVVGYLFSKRQPTKMSKMMGGKSGRMGKELVGADGEKGRYFQKSRTAKRMTHKFYEVDKPHEPQMKAMGMGKMQKRGNVRERITEFASPRTSPIKVQGYSVSRSYTTKRSVNKSNTRMARKIHEIDAHNYYGEEKMKKPNTFRKNAMGNPINIGGSMNSFMPNTTTMPRRPMVQRTMPHAKTPTPMGMRPMNPMNRVNNNRFTAYPTARSMATGMPPTMRGGFGKRGR